MLKRDESEFLEIEGMITPGLWTKRGDIIAVNISTKDRQELFVAADSNLAEDLIKFCWKVVRLRGLVSLNRDGYRVMDPNSYEIVTDRSETESQERRSQHGTSHQNTA